MLGEPLTWSHPHFQDRIVWLWTELAAHYRDEPWVAGYNLLRSSVFPVEANGTQWVRLTYEHILQGDAKRVDYVLPRSEMLDYAVPWKVTVKIRSSRGVSMTDTPWAVIGGSRRSASPGFQRGVKARPCSPSRGIRFPIRGRLQYRRRLPPCRFRPVSGQQ